MLEQAFLPLTGKLVLKSAVEGSGLETLLLLKRWNLREVLLEPVFAHLLIPPSKHLSPRRQRGVSVMIE